MNPETYEPVHPTDPPPHLFCANLYLDNRTTQLWIGDRWINIHPGHQPTDETPQPEPDDDFVADAPQDLDVRQRQLNESLLQRQLNESLDDHVTAVTDRFEQLTDRFEQLRDWALNVSIDNARRIEEARNVAADARNVAAQTSRAHNDLAAEARQTALDNGRTLEKHLTSIREWITRVEAATNGSVDKQAIDNLYDAVTQLSRRADRAHDRAVDVRDMLSEIADITYVDPHEHDDDCDGACLHDGHYDITPTPAFIDAVAAAVTAKISHRLVNRIGQDPL